MSVSIHGRRLSEEGVGVAQEQDEDRLAELGYKQELRRDWSLLHNFGISFSIIVSVYFLSTGRDVPRNPYGIAGSRDISVDANFQEAQKLTIIFSSRV